MKEKKRILITGSSGFIGTNLLISLKSQNYDIAVIDRSRNTNFKNVKNIKFNESLKKQICNYIKRSTGILKPRDLNNITDQFEILTYQLYLSNLTTCTILHPKI